MNAGDDVEVRRARLRALRERYPPASPEPAADRAQPAQERPGGAERLPVPVGRRAGAAKRHGARPAAGGLLQRVATFLSQEGPGARFVSGTPVREDRLGQLVQFLERRGAAANNPQAQRARGILAYLTDSAPGERTIAGVSVARAVALLERARGQRPPDSERSAGFAGAAEIIEGDVLAVDPEPAEQKREVGDLAELVARAQRLSEALLAVQKQIAQQLDGRGAPAAAEAAGRARAAKAAPAAVPPKASSDWYLDFLD
ncbi:MAG: hypothetical protein JNM60_12030 [Candidatus Competibacteraceae bacterium]|nr:hypothetical protein [Candidatus Competibacteraceae bacterium]